MLTFFDHVTITVLDIAAAVSAYTRLLGAGPTWRGEHPELGTAAGLFGLANSLIEIVGPRDEAPEAEAFRTLLATRGEGLQAFAFGCDDAAATSAGFRTRGLRATPPQDGEARGTDGVTRTYRTVELSTRNTRGISVFAVERAKPEELRGPPQLDPSAMHALDHVAIRTADIDAARALYGEGMGVRLALESVVAGRRMLFFRIGAVTLEVVEDKSVGEQDAFYGLTYRVRDLEAAHARLASAGFALSELRQGMKPGTRVFTVRDGTCGVPTLILRDPTRDG